MKQNHKSTLPAFTLIELLVVIAIIAMLAGVALPAFNNAQLTAKMTRAMSNARQIFLALKCYASDHDGAYPGGTDTHTSNDAFRELFPAYLQVEANFVVANSPVGKKADNKIDPPSRILEPGENHWAYIAGLNDTSHPLWPLIVDHTDGNGFYTTQENEPGGTWRGTKAVVIRCDGGAEAKRLAGTGNKRFIPRFDDEQKNALQVREYMGETARLLEPAR
jgi:prepilin-type N-terminal cleavage/methylation domain-containing protein